MIGRGDHFPVFKVTETPATEPSARTPKAKGLNGAESFEKIFNRSSEVLNAIRSNPASKPQPSNFVVTIQDYFKTALPVRASAYAARKNLSPEPAEVKGNSFRPAAEMDPKIADAIQEMSAKYNVPAALVESVMGAESNFNPKAQSKAGAQGLMQLMPGTAKEMGVQNSFDVRENVEGGVRYLRKMMDLFGQDERLALAAYNAGPGAVKKYGGVPPYKETRNYVDKILTDYAAKKTV